MFFPKIIRIGFGDGRWDGVNICNVLIIYEDEIRDGRAIMNALRILKQGELNCKEIRIYRNRIMERAPL